MKAYNKEGEGMPMIKRKIAATLISATLLLSSMTSIVYGEELIHQKINTEKLANGVTQQNIVRFTENGWANINVLYVDLKDPSIGLQLMQSSNGLQTKETLSTMTKVHNNVIGAINGDFFYLTTPDSPMGVMVQDGKVISSSVIDQNFASLFVYNTNTAFTDYLKLEIFLSNITKGTTLKIDAVNKLTWEYRMVTLVDRNWGKTTPGATETRQDIVEVVIIDNTVVEIRQGQPAIEIPENGYVLFAVGAKANDILNAVALGDEIALDYTPDVANMKLAMGGGTQLVKNGQVVPFTQTVTGNHPRTAVGVSKDGTQLIMVAVDGRHQAYRGMDGQQLAKLMIELGSNEAVIMDGGGSTTMVSRRLGTFSPRLINIPSDGSERRIINGLAVVSKATSVGNLYGIVAEADYPSTFKGLARQINVRAFDQNYNPLTVNSTELSFNLIAGKGTFTGNTFTPETSGDIVIGVTYQGATTEVKLKVYEELAGINITPNQMQLGFGKSTRLNVVGVDPNGYRVPIANSSLIWTDTRGLGTFKDGVYTAGTVGGNTVLEASYGNIMAYAAVAVGLGQATIDDFESFRASYLGFPAEVTGKVTHEAAGQTGKGVGLEFDFTTTDASRAAYIVYDNGGVTLAEKQDKLGLSVFATEASTAWIRGRIKDANGGTHVIDFSKGVNWTGWKYLEAAVPANLAYPIAIDRIYAVETEAAQKYKGKLIFDDLQALKGLTVEPLTQEATKVIDPLNRESEAAGVRLVAHTGIQKKTFTLLDRLVTNQLNSLINTKYEYALFTEVAEPKLTSGIKKPMINGMAGFSKTEYKNSIFIQMDNRSGGIRQTNYRQYGWLKHEVEQSKMNNVFVILPRPIWGTNGFTDTMEADLFAEMLTELSEKGRKVFVLYGEGDVKADVVNGVRYIGTGSYKGDSSKNPLDAFKYVEFNVTDTEVTYQIKSIF